MNNNNVKSEQFILSILLFLLPYYIIGQENLQLTSENKLSPYLKEISTNSRIINFNERTQEGVSREVTLILYSDGKYSAANMGMYPVWGKCQINDSLLFEVNGAYNPNNNFTYIFKFDDEEKSMWFSDFINYEYWDLDLITGYSEKFEIEGPVESTTRYLIIDKYKSINMNNIIKEDWACELISNHENRFLFKISYVSNTSSFEGQCSHGFEEGFLLLDLDVVSKNKLYGLYYYESCWNNIQSESEEISSNKFIYRCESGFSNKKKFQLIVDLNYCTIERK